MAFVVELGQDAVNAIGFTFIFLFTFFTLSVHDSGREQDLFVTVGHYVPVQHSKNQWRQAREENVVQLNVKVIVQIQGTEATKVGKEELRHCHDTVLVEEVVNERRDR